MPHVSIAIKTRLFTQVKGSRLPIKFSLPRIRISGQYIVKIKIENIKIISKISVLLFNYGSMAYCALHEEIEMFHESYIISSAIHAIIF